MGYSFTSNLNGLSSSGANDYLASLQTPVTQSNAANQVSVGPTGVQPASYVGGNQITLPSWLSSNPDTNLGELKQSYNNVGSAYDPTDQVNARNAAIGYQTQAGTQAANNAATEYSNRAAQSGGSSLGAGTVKAQNMLGVYKSNADLRTQAADVAAKTKQEGVTLAATIANNLGSLRNSYLGTLANYASEQSKLATQNNQFNSSLSLQNWQAQQSVANEAANRQYQYTGLQEDATKNLLTNYTQQSDLALRAAQALQSEKMPTGAWIDSGISSDPSSWNISTPSGINSYNQQKDWLANQQQATSALSRISNYY